MEDTHAGRAQALNNADPYQAWLDLDELQVPLSVRSRRPGDRFEPLGMGGETQKLADFMVNVKLPRRARDGWPLVCSGDEVAWVPGYRLAHPFKLGDQTARLSHIMMLRSST